MTITTNVLDRAAFFIIFGGKLIEIRGSYPNNEFILEVSRVLAFYESIGGWVPYKKFCNERRVIKRRTRRMAGLPEHFTGDKDSHFTLGDLTKVFKK